MHLNKSLLFPSYPNTNECICEHAKVTDTLIHLPATKHVIIGTTHHNLNPAGQRQKGKIQHMHVGMVQPLNGLALIIGEHAVKGVQKTRPQTDNMSEEM